MANMLIYLIKCVNTDWFPTKTGWNMFEPSSIASLARSHMSRTRKKYEQTRAYLFSGWIIFEQFALVRICTASCTNYVKAKRFFFVFESCAAISVTDTKYKCTSAHVWWPPNRIESTEKVIKLCCGRRCAQCKKWQPFKWRQPNDFNNEHVRYPIS